MSIISKTLTFHANINQDEEWASREGANSYLSWSVYPSAGVTIHNPTQRVNPITFNYDGEYDISVKGSDGAFPYSDTKHISINKDTPSEIELSHDKTTLLPIKIEFPKGSIIFDKMDCVIDIDCTPSMSTAINKLKGSIASVVNELHKYANDVQVAIVSHGSPADTQYHIGTDLTDSPLIVQNAVGILTSNMEYTDDLKDHHGSIERTVDSISWRPDSHKFYILIGNSGDDIDYKQTLQVLTNQYQIRPIMINTWKDNSRDPQRYMKNVAEFGNGYYISEAADSIDFTKSISKAINNIDTHFNIGIQVNDDNIQDINVTASNIGSGDTCEISVVYKKIPEGTTQDYKTLMNIVANDEFLIDTIQVHCYIND